MRQRTFYLENMVSSRCITVVKLEMEQLGVKVSSINLSNMVTHYDPDAVSVNQIRNVLAKHKLGFVEDKEGRLVESIKLSLRNLVINNTGKLDEKISELLSKQHGHSYNHLSRLFTKRENLTIEKYLILLKVEKVKALLETGSHSLSSIAKQLSYSSTQHLSRQFKSTTGISVSDYKKFMQAQRVSPDTF